jgi:hypothetical protein
MVQSSRAALLLPTALSTTPGARAENLIGVCINKRTSRGVGDMRLAEKELPVSARLLSSVRAAAATTTTPTTAPSSCLQAPITLAARNKHVDLVFRFLEAGAE